MTQSLGPHTPKSGYRQRWMRQAGALMLRAPLTLVVLLVGSALLSIPAAAITALARISLGVDLPTAALLMDIFSVPAVVAPLVLATALLLKADLDQPSAWADLWPVIRSGTVVAFLINGVILLVTTLIFDNPEPGDSAQAVFPESGGIFFAIAFLGKSALQNALIVCSIYSPFLLAGMLCARVSRSEIRAMDLIFRRQNHAIHMEIFFTLVLLAILSLLMGPLGYFVLAYAAAWVYVATREVIGGISENGTPAPAPSRHTAAQPG